MGRPRRRSAVARVRTDPHELLDLLPEQLRNPNSVGSGITLDGYRRSVADYLRTAGIDPQLAPDVSAATGVAVAIVFRDRLLSAGQHEAGAPKEQEPHGT